MLDAASALPETIYTSLRAGILAQHFEPGSRVTESTVAIRFGVARPTAKLAIERLVSEGLLRRELHHAARVPVLDRHDIIDVFDNRAVVEGAAVRALATTGTVPTAALTAHRALLGTGADFAESDIAFHRALVAGQPSSRLTRMHSLLMGEVELCIGQVEAAHLLTATEVGRQHQAIVDAIVAANPDLAFERIRAHIHSSRDALVAHLDEKVQR